MERPRAAFVLLAVAVAVIVSPGPARSLAAPTEIKDDAGGRFPAAGSVEDVAR